MINEEYILKSFEEEGWKVKTNNNNFLVLRKNFQELIIYKEEDSRGFKMVDVKSAQHITVTVPPKITCLVSMLFELWGWC